MLTYQHDERDVAALRGVFEGIYPHYEFTNWPAVRLDVCSIVATVIPLYYHTVHDQCT